MRRLAALFPILCSATLLGGCAQPGSGARPDTLAADTMAAAPAVAPTAAMPTQGDTISLAALAGRWNVRSVPESGTDTATTVVLTATSDTTGWTFAFPNREPIPLRIVRVAGDSIVLEAGPYESAIRPGVQVRTEHVMRLQNDRLVGTTVARYAIAGADSVVRLRTEATRVP